jgi:hypothetical protein
LNNEEHEPEYMISISSWKVRKELLVSIPMVCPEESLIINRINENESRMKTIS